MWSALTSLVVLLIASCLLAHVQCLATVDSTQFCTLQCNMRLHTLCPTETIVKCQQGKATLVEVKDFETIDIRNLLISGHNGLRDRIAHRMRAANMIELAWSNTLESMAMAYMKDCTPYHDDVCTQFKHSLAYDEVFTYFDANTMNLLYVAQNRFCMHSKFVTSTFVEMVLRKWYFEKDNMTAPQYLLNQHLKTEYGVLSGENNFTHLAYPLVAEFGCGIAKYNKDFCIMCNYYPYYRFANNTMQFGVGSPATACPAEHPLRHEFFDGLCTGGHKKDGGSHVQAPFYCALLTVLTVILFS